MIEKSQELLHVSSSPASSIRSHITGKFGDYLALTKPEINALALISTFAGGWLALTATGTALSLHPLADAIFGTALVAGGAGTLNQVLEWRFDALMYRTTRRPVASGRISVVHAMCFGLLLVLTGVTWLLAYANIRAALLAVFALATYIVAYTPLKRRSPACILVGALSGAVPPLIGWTACGGSFNLEAGLIFALLFFWQFPHFMAIAWLCRKDYERAGYRVIPADRSRKTFIAVATVLPALCLLGVTLFPAFARHAWMYIPLISVAGLAFLFFAGRFVVQKSASTARQLLTASIYYIPIVFALLILMESYHPSIP